MSKVLDCFVIGPFSGQANLIDSQTLQPAQLPAKASILGVFAHCEASFSDDVLISLGWTEDSAGIFGVAAGLTLSSLSANDWHFTPTGGVFTNAITTTATITAALPVLSAGRLRLKIVYAAFDDII